MAHDLEAEKANKHISGLLGKYNLLLEERLKHYHNWNRNVFRVKKYDLFEPILKGSLFVIPATGLLLKQIYGIESLAASGALLVVIGIFVSFLQAYDFYLYFSMRAIKSTAAFHFLQALEFRNRNRTIDLLGETTISIDETLANLFEEDAPLRQVREIDGQFYSSIELLLLVVGTLVWAFG